MGRGQQLNDTRSTVSREAGTQGTRPQTPLQLPSIVSRNGREPDTLITVSRAAILPPNRTSVMLTRRVIVAGVVMFTILGALPGAERPTPQPFKAGRSVTVAKNGIVATSHPLAAQIGLDVLKRG